MPNYRIFGGQPLYGSVRVGGAKNASYKLMVASLLADSPSRILNFSHISDVGLVAGIINELGAKAELVGDRAYKIDPTSLSKFEVDNNHGEASRASTMFIPALLHKFQKAVVPFPGGDKIGARPLDRHFDGLKAMGVDIEVKNQQIVCSINNHDGLDGKGCLKGCHYRFSKNSHTGTETLVMAAVCAQGETILENAAEETEIDNLISFLNAMGGQVKRQPNRVIQIQGVPKLHGAIQKIMSDQNQVVSFACAALATKGDVIVENAMAKDLRAFIQKLEEVKAGYEIGNYGIRFYYKGQLQATDVTTAVHPGFKTDWQPLWVTLMTQAKGVSILHETVYENRFAYVDSLKQMGADIELFNPPVTNPDEVYNFNVENEKPGALHAARITGPASLKAGTFEVKDLRHGATLMIAGMIAQGETILHDEYDQIGRGYEFLDEHLLQMGAKIEKF